MTESTDIQSELANAVLQADFALSTIKRFISGSDKRFELNIALILKLHGLALATDNARTGQFRDIDIHVEGSEHHPPSPERIANEIENLCHFVNSNWDRKSPLYLSAYILWKLNWIHPFSDGNGRTARALGYIVLCVGFGFLLPGTQTILEQLRNRRSEYFDALAAADMAYRNNQRVDVSALEAMLTEMLERQLSSVLTLAEDMEIRLAKTIAQRIYDSQPEFLASNFGSLSPVDRLWIVGDVAILQIAPTEELDKAARRHDEFGNPFPGLFSVHRDRAQVTVSDGSYFVSASHYVLKAGLEAALYLSPTAGTIVPMPEIAVVDVPTKGWRSVGVLYVVRLGPDVTSDDLVKILDALIAKHLAMGG